MWLLDPDVTHLNHGSFGATPIRVLEDQNDWRRRLESNPVRFFDEEYHPALAEARRRLIAFLGGDERNTAFVTNATSGVNAVLSSLPLEPDDEIIVTNHEYNACRQAAEAWAGRAGGKVVEVSIPFPPQSPKLIAERIMMAVGSNTRLVIIDHVTSPTALIFPVEAVVAALEPEVPVLIDGAHAPGMLPIDVGALGASFYVGNLHKWVCAPKGAGFVSVAERHAEELQPPVISHGWNMQTAEESRMQGLFDWMGTDDPSARLAVPAAIDTMENAHPDGWEGVRSANHTLVVEGRRIIADALGLDAGPAEDWVGSMAALILPGEPEDGVIVDELTARLRHNHAIEVPVFAWEGQRVLRLSAQRYNRLDDYRRLVDALIDELD
ncbi:MAG TPA: aminotransferase class V-fold PLP-dependent enzyme [Acidimicrobiia bacterium]|nr:aminotransferase class V-fold PLP-dependent enzyme [Acidimicrobiia bacterium]